MSLSKFLEGTGREHDPYVCAFCGNCTMVCPTFHQLKWEPYGPRGKLQVTKEILEGEISIEKEYVHRLFLCSLCEHCTQICTTSIPLDEFWLVLRKSINLMALLPSSVIFICKSVEKFGDPFAMGKHSRMLWARNLEKVTKERVRKKAEIAYFVGCSTALKPQLQDIAQSMVTIFERAKTDFTLLGEKETCCGAPLLWAGDPEKANSMAEENITWFRQLEVTKVVFNCPSCLEMMRRAYGELYGKPVENEFEFLTTSQFILALIKKGVLEFEEQPLVTVTYHDPCIAVRKLAVLEEPRQIIDHIPGVYKVELINSKEETHCCGSHGLLNMVDPLLSSRIAENRLREVSITPASRVITDCPGCFQAFKLATQTMEYPIEIQHIAQLVANALSGDWP